MALFLWTRRGHHSRLITPAAQPNAHNCAQFKFDRRKLQANNYSKSSSSSCLLLKNDASTSIRFEDYQSADGLQIVRSATVLQLVEHLTSAKLIGSNFAQTFFLTFRLFCLPTKLLDLLIRRFQVLTPLRLQATASDSLYGYFRDRHKSPIQKRVLQVLYFWICNHPADFASDSSLLHHLEMFLDGKICDFTILQRLWCAKIKHTLKQNLLSEENRENGALNEIQSMLVKRRQRHKLQSKFSAYLYINSKNGFINSENFWHLKPSKIAKQLTLIHFHLYRSIQSMELLNNAWLGANKNCESPHLVKMIEFSTNLTYWVVRSIVEQTSAEKRALVISKVLGVMQECLQLQNFNAFVELYSALNQTAIYRLKKTKSMLSQESQALMQHFQSLFDPHWKLLSTMTRNCSLPCIPFIGAYLSQLVFLESGQPTILERNVDPQSQLISFRKCRKIASVVEEIRRFQRQSYYFKLDTGIIRFILSINPEHGFNSRAELEDYLYQKSLCIEPVKRG